ncbi:hypothetical protein ABT174_10035 [Streptomyces sparsogenes]|uniref:hypothetical protein n=1 Tax=Streptomyces sparsogenes TaxID=67365 RepID=UPI0033285EE1
MHELLTWLNSLLDDKFAMSKEVAGTMVTVVPVTLPARERTAAHATWTALDGFFVWASTSWGFLAAHHLRRERTQ